MSYPSGNHLAEPVTIDYATAVLAHGAIITALPYLNTQELRDSFQMAADRLHDAIRTVEARLPADAVTGFEVNQAIEVALWLEEELAA